MQRPPNDATLIFLRKGNEVLLGMKKRGFGKGKWNGYGGKPENNESIDACAQRELGEECGVFVDIQNLVHRGFLDFYFSENPSWNQRVHLYEILIWEGTPKETEEMVPGWFEEDKIDYSKTWIDDKYWLPKLLQGYEIQASFTFGGSGEGSFIERMTFTKPEQYAPKILPQDMR